MLTIEQAAELKDGDVVRVKWSGGNGPHIYVVQRDHNDNVIARSPHALVRDYYTDALVIVDGDWQQRGVKLIHMVERVHPTFEGDALEKLAHTDQEAGDK